MHNIYRANANDADCLIIINNNQELFISNGLYKIELPCHPSFI